MVQPAATAGPILRVPIARGKFHGVMSRQGPTGCFMVSSREPPAGASAYRPSIRTASSLNQRRNSAAYVTSVRDSARLLPISSVMSMARSSTRSVISCQARRRISPRSRGGVAAHSVCASTAASNADAASSACPSATWHSRLLVPGSSTQKPPPPLASRHSPAT